MRYYSITITDPKTGEVIRPSVFTGLQLPDTYTSYVNGRSLPGALNVELSIPVYNYAVPEAGSFVRVWGVSKQELSQARNLAEMDIVVRAGMQKGLPLAKPAQAGVIIQGAVWQAFGNWIGTEMSLDLILRPGISAKPKNFTFQWKAKSPMADAIRTTLSAALPDKNLLIAISPQLIKDSDETDIKDSIEGFAKTVLNLSRAKQFQGIKTLSGASYSGVNIATRGNQIVVYDGTSSYGETSYASPRQIDFEDMIGQPTWIGPSVINFKTVMRSDLAVADYVKLPSRLTTPYVITTPGSSLPGTPARNESTFEGKFLINRMQHFGNYRQADAAAWVTSFNAVFAPPPPGSANPNVIGGP